MFFKIIGNVLEVEVIARGRSIREGRRLRKLYGGRRWRKLKGVATVELADGTLVQPSFTGTKRTAWAAGNSRSSAFSTFYEAQ
jgi:hypothetical protein